MVALVCKSPCFFYIWRITKWVSHISLVALTYGCHIKCDFEILISKNEISLKLRENILIEQEFFGKFYISKKI
jgi:hypothetical protein